MVEALQVLKFAGMVLRLTVRVILHYGQDILILCFVTNRQAMASSREALIIES